MLKPVTDDSTAIETPRQRRKRRRLKTISMLPTLVTLGSLCFGFAAIYCCARELEDLGAQRKPADVMTLRSEFFEEYAGSFLSIAAWMVLAAMICDALDGSVARKTGSMSRFGEQLDSFADVVAFGVAPALMMVTLIRRELAYGNPDMLEFERFGPTAMMIGMVYASCAALRLARFNVEATMEEALHTGFRGLPSPGAAGAVISLVYFQDQVHLKWPYLANGATTLAPFATLAIGLLMISRLPYTHAVTRVFLSRRPLYHVVVVLIGILLMIRYTEFVCLLAAWAFVLSGPVMALVRRFQGAPVVADSQPAQPSTPQSVSWTGKQAQ